MCLAHSNIDDYLRIINGDSINKLVQKEHTTVRIEELLYFFDFEMFCNFTKIFFLSRQTDTVLCIMIR
jgi:hypothetical protein